MLALFTLFNLACAILLPHANAQPKGKNNPSTYVFYGKDGKLQYKKDPQGNRIVDFSSAGYGGGGVKLPEVPTRVSISPSGGDNTAAIQSALSRVASMPPDANGIRGAVELGPGIFTVSKTLLLGTSGVVLRGSRSEGPNSTVINMVGSPFLLFNVGGNGPVKKSNEVALTDAYIPSGATSFNVTSTAGFQVGDRIAVEKLVTKEWIVSLGMDKLVRDRKPQIWLKPGTRLPENRVIIDISKNGIKVDVNLVDSFDGKFANPVGFASKVSLPGSIKNVGVENIAIVAPAKITDDYYRAISMNFITDSWLANLRATNVQNGISLGDNSEYLTLRNVEVAHTYRQPNAAKPADFTYTGAQILFDNCSVTGHGNTWPYTTHRGNGPNVLLKCRADENGIDPHDRYNTATLADSCKVQSIDVGNNGFWGSGHGWTAESWVLWNTDGDTMVLQSPPGGYNYAIGCKAKLIQRAAPGSNVKLPNGIIESLNESVTPYSLYLAQLRDRLGDEALRAIGYADVDGTPITEH